MDLTAIMGNPPPPPHKKNKQGGGRKYLISRGIKEIACRISSKGDQGKIQKNNVEFPRSWFLALEFSRDMTKFCGISKSEALFCVEFPVVK